MIADLMNVNSKLGKCLRSAFLSASRDKQRQLSRLLQKTAISIEDVLQNPIKIPSYLLMKISDMLEATQSVREIIMAYQFSRSGVR
nr:hypothetical protein BdHM001_32180 [Bdellovibrio sp. HM001]